MILKTIFKYYQVVKEFEPEPDAFTNDNNNNHMLRVMYER